MTDQPLVVCIDDDPQVLAAIRRLLRREPVRIVTLEDPREVLQVVSTLRVDLIIADQRMPGILGTDLLKSIRKTSLTSRPC